MNGAVIFEQLVADVGGANLRLGDAVWCAPIISTKDTQVDICYIAGDDDRARKYQKKIVERFNACRGIVDPETTISSLTSLAEWARDLSQGLLDDIENDRSLDCEDTIFALRKFNEAAIAAFDRCVFGE